ncbi:MAG: HU family DNA-binding protein [Muribaculaceae bacterium]
MNKAELINAISEETKLKKTDSKLALEAILKIISEKVYEGERVSLLGFGTFKLVEKAARIGVNPTTHQKIEIPAKRAIKFNPSADFSDKVK